MLASMFSSDSLEQARRAREEHSRARDDERQTRSQEIYRRIEEQTVACTCTTTNNTTQRKRKLQRASEEETHIERIEKCMSSFGVCLLRSDTPLIGQKILSRLRRRADIVERVICARLDELNICYKDDNVSSVTGGRELAGLHGTASGGNRAQRIKALDRMLETEKQASFKFQQVSSRCLGRLDVRLDDPLNDRVFGALLGIPRLQDIVAKLLGSDARLAYMGLILNFPGILGNFTVLPSFLCYHSCFHHPRCFYS
jgi:hypothetical protein